MPMPIVASKESDLLSFASIARCSVAVNCPRKLMIMFCLCKTEHVSISPFCRTMAPLFIQHFHWRVNANKNNFTLGFSKRPANQLFLLQIS